MTRTEVRRCALSLGWEEKAALGAGAATDMRLVGASILAGQPDRRAQGKCAGSLWKGYGEKTVVFVGKSEILCMLG